MDNDWGPSLLRAVDRHRSATSYRMWLLASLSLAGSEAVASPSCSARPRSEAPLSPEQLAGYRRDGFLVVRRLLTTDETALVGRAIETDTTFNDKRWTTYLADDAGGKTRLNLWSFAGNSTLGLLTRSRRVFGAMRQLRDGEVLHYHSKTRVKHPNAGGMWNWHQDYGAHFCQHPRAALPQCRGPPPGEPLQSSKPAFGCFTSVLLW